MPPGYTGGMMQQSRCVNERTNFMTQFYIHAIEAKKMADALAHCMAVKDATRYYLHGICLENTGEGLRALATDGHRMGRLSLHPLLIDSVTAAPITGDFSHILPVEAVQWLAKLPAKYDYPELLNIEIENTQVTLTTLLGKQSAIFTLVDGQFPEWRRVWPQAVPATIALNALYLKDVAQAVKKACDKKMPQISLGISNHTQAAYISTPDSDLDYIVMPMRLDDISLQANGDTILHQLEALASQCRGKDEKAMARMINTIAGSLREVIYGKPAAIATETGQGEAKGVKAA